MELIINIPEEIYIEKKEDYIGDTLDKAIANGTPLSEELEKIKAEIEQIIDEEQKYDKKWAKGLQYSLKIIDNHISELKGE